MARSWEARKRRTIEVEKRAREPSQFFHQCRVLGCRKPARAGTEDGLDTRFCRSHSDHYARHGSPYKRSYRAAELEPHRRAAVGWLAQHGSNRWVQNAVQRVQGLYDRAGPHVEAFRLSGLPPRERAWKAWARLRHRGVDPRRVIAVWLAVELTVGNDPQRVDTTEFKRVQAAKLVHRLASGSHKRWPGRPAGRAELHVYPASRGRVLRYIGADLEGAVALLVQRVLADLTRSGE